MAVLRGNNYLSGMTPPCDFELSKVKIYNNTNVPMHKCTNVARILK
jgi:hypothetical protein